jgi:ATP-dependent DNA ligase
MHPKTEIRPDRAAMKRVLDAGWAGQLKMHGHRAQIHVSADPSVEPLAYTRHGKVHTKRLPASLVAELRRIFQPDTSWTVLDVEWIKARDALYVFDILKRQGRLLSDQNYAQRWESLPRVFASDWVHCLPILRTIDRCLEALADPNPEIEGLVFKALMTPGFHDTSIIRCRRNPL